MEDIIVRDLCKSFHGKPVLDHVSLRIPKGVVTGLMAPSGAGKTTLLRILLGLEIPDSGSVMGICSGDTIGAVFQEDRLCPHLDAVANIRLVSPALTEREVKDALRVLRLDYVTGQPVLQLSGGEKRRIALLRATMSSSTILLLDEPFQGLDADTRELVIRDTVARCRNRTVLAVSHSREELNALGAKLLPLSEYT